MTIISSPAALLPVKTKITPSYPSGGYQSFDTEVISSEAALSAIRSEWEALEQLSSAAAVFQRHSHLSIWARHFLRRDHGRRALHVIVVRKKGRVALILPVVVATTGFPRING